MVSTSVKYPKYPTKINWNTKHTDYPDQKVMKTDIHNLENIQPTIMPEKVEKIKQAIIEGKAFNPLIVYPGTLKIFDGNHRYFAIMDLFGASNIDVFYIEQVTKPEVKTMDEIKTVATNEDAIKRLIDIKKNLNNDLQKIINDLKKDQPVTSTTQAAYNPVHSPRQRPADEKPGEPNKPAKPDSMKEKIKAYIEKEHSSLTDLEKDALQDCVHKKIPIFRDEHPDWDMDHIIAASFGYCKEQNNKV